MQSTIRRYLLPEGITTFVFTPALTDEQEDELGRVINRVPSRPELRQGITDWATNNGLTLSVERERS
jgi:hypothetical protein